MPIVVLPLLAVAAVMLLVWYAGEQLNITPFQGIAHSGGTVGGLMLRWLESGIQWAINQAEGVVNDAVNGLLGLISQPIHWIQQHLDDLANSLLGAYTALLDLREVFIPRIVDQALSTARGWVNSLQNFTVQQIDNVYHWASPQFTAVYNYVNTEISLAEGYTRTLVDNLEKYTAAGLAADAQYAEQLYTDSIHYTTAAVDGLEGWVTGEISGVTDWVTGEIGTATSWATAALAAQAVWTQSLVGTVEADLTKLKVECTDNLCSSLGPLANLINDLAGDLGLAGLVALAGEFARDPKGAAGAVESVLKPVVDAASSVMRETVGV